MHPCLTSYKECLLQEFLFFSVSIATLLRGPSITQTVPEQVSLWTCLFVAMLLPRIITITRKEKLYFRDHLSLPSNISFSKGKSNFFNMQEVPIRICIFIRSLSFC